MATPPKGADRRVQRTRDVIRKAFIAVVREKGLDGASVREITQRANISRGTFYAHYADKHAFIEIFAREEFQKMANALPMPQGLTRPSLALLIQSVLEYFQAVYQGHRLAPQVAPLLERAIHEELHSYLLRLLQATIDPETQAQLLSWAIFGAAMEWSALPQKSTAAQKAKEMMNAFNELSGLTVRP